MNLEIQNLAALVCGGSRGIGLACAQKLAEEGANVAILARDPSVLEAALKTLPNNGKQKHRFIAVDLQDSAKAQLAVKKAMHEMGPFFILVNNSGGPKPGPILSAPTAEFTTAFANHLLASHTLVQTLHEGMRELGGGRIVNIISTSVKQPIPGLGVSNTIRAAVGSWAKTLAGELGPNGITVNNVLPGWTRTARLEAIISAKAKQQGISIAAQEEYEQAYVPLRRFAEPNEVADVVTFLCSKRASYISGTNVVVDGGRTYCL